MRTLPQAKKAIKTLRYAIKKRCPHCRQKRFWIVLDTCTPGPHRFIVQAHCHCGYMTFREAE